MSTTVDHLQSLPGIEGINVEFTASGESDPTDSPSDLAIKVNTASLLRPVHKPSDKSALSSAGYHCCICTHTIYTHK